jgi:hypothetical protein
MEDMLADAGEDCAKVLQRLQDVDKDRKMFEDFQTEKWKELNANHKQEIAKR